MSHLLAVYTPTTRPSAHDMATMLIFGLVVVVVFLFGTLAIMRFSRHYRSMLLDEPKEPTASDDVWKQHRLPEDWRDQQED